MMEAASPRRRSKSRKTQQCKQFRDTSLALHRANLTMGITETWTHHSLMDSLLLRGNRTMGFSETWTHHSLMDSAEKLIFLVF
jgi:hypothetical protein